VIHTIIVSYRIVYGHVIWLADLDGSRHVDDLAQLWHEQCPVLVVGRVGDEREQRRHNDDQMVGAVRQLTNRRQHAVVQQLLQPTSAAIRSIQTLSLSLICLSL